MAWQPSPLMTGFDRGVDGTDPWNNLAPGGERGPLAPDPAAEAVAQTYQKIQDALARQQQISVDQGYWTGGQPWEGGHPTQAGLLDAIRQTGTAVALGTGGGKGEPPPGFTAYHGSPHLFPPTEANPLGAFDPAKIGTGEGGAAYGVGAAYVAEHEPVAQEYRDLLRWRGANYNDPQIVAASAIDRVGGDRELAASNLQTALENTRNFYRGNVPAGQAAADSVKARAVDLLRGSEPITAQPPTPGHMYEVQVNADPEWFLHWDKPLSEQHPDVRAALKNTPYPPHDMAMTGKEYLTALETNREMATKEGDPAALASQALQQAGIPGIRYLDKDSRVVGHGTHNYVVFDANSMNIIRRYGLAALMAGASGYGASLSGGSSDGGP